jgi:Fe-coproporphyrin III synthase
MKSAVRTSKLNQVLYLAGFAIKSRLSDKYKKPLLCSFKLTNRCTLKCRHCPFWRNMQKIELEYEKIEEILKKLHADGVRIVIFEGGEPLIWEDKKKRKNISDVIDIAKKFFDFVGVTTNGTVDLSLINPDVIFISIDGLQKTHDSIRGKSFDRIISNIEKYKKVKKIIANICISRANLKEIPELIKFLNDKVYGITIQFFYPYLRVEDQSLTIKEKTSLLKELLKLKKDGYKIFDSSACLTRMAGNTWRCYDFLVASVDPDGTVNYGCYLKNRVENISCMDCGFTAHCEISLAYRFNIDALNAARKIFW